MRVYVSCELASVLKGVREIKEKLAREAESEREGETGEPFRL